jgi:3-hydroxyacyl-CoA dehydrogenase
MQYDQKFREVSVLGAAGKMGSGIILLTAVEMTDLALKPENKGLPFLIHAIDVSKPGLLGLYDYIKTQVVKIAEKKTVLLRKVYANEAELRENEEIIDRYVDDVMKRIHFSTRLEAAYESELVFEAAIEDADLKVKMLSQIRENSSTNPWFLTNTSSVPIRELNEKAGLNGNIISFHFYNPPAVQKLVELVTPKGTNPELIDFAFAFGEKIGRRIVQANDFAGFIGNGFFMPEVVFAIEMVHSLSGKLPMPQAIYAVNKVVQQFLLRPMGIFQLIDYVGIDVCQKIMLVMNSRLENAGLHSDFIDLLMAQDVKGGQNSDGSQKPGFFKYQKGQPQEVYNPSTKEYISVDSIKNEVDQYLGSLPVSYQPWKSVIGLKNRQEFLNPYFAELKAMDTQGAVLARKYLEKTKEIGKNLVRSGVANSYEDVNTAMTVGFFHAFGPVNEFV